MHDYKYEWLPEETIEDSIFYFFFFNRSLVIIQQSTEY